MLMTATSALVFIIQAVLPFRSEGTPTVDLVARPAAQASRLLQLEREELTAVHSSLIARTMFDQCAAEIAAALVGAFFYQPC